MRRTLGLMAVATGWALVGGLLWVYAPRDRALAPERASFTYGAKRTTFSSAPGGTLAFYRVLERLGYECERRGDFSLPEIGVLFILEPEIWLEDLEVTRLLDWARRGGSLVYAPSRVEATVAEEGRTRSIAVEDPVLDALRSTDRAALSAGVTLVRLGAGRITIVEGGGARLSNQALFETGIGSELGWLEQALAGHERVSFDEARAGAMLSGGLLTLLFSGALRGPLTLSALALGLAFWGAFRREVPARSLEPDRENGEREHIFAVARALRREGRQQLARDALIRGTARRLGNSADAESRLEQLREGNRSTEALARALRDLERELGSGR